MGREGCSIKGDDRWISIKAAGEDARPFSFAQGRLTAGGTPALVFLRRLRGQSGRERRLIPGSIVRTAR
jgi:hypothetical protein